eukprot:Tbor_TRINITY_DN5366_c1_g1::TRINITY_DN5366_c1_g1_i1::g.3800::m.3800
MKNNNNNNNKNQKKTGKWDNEHDNPNSPQRETSNGYGGLAPLPLKPKRVLSDSNLSEISSPTSLSALTSPLPEKVIPAEVLSYITCLTNVLSMLLRNALTYTAWTLVDFFVVLTLSHCLPSSDAFGGVATAMTITSLTSTSLTLGLSSALDTLLSVQFGKDPRSTVIAEYFRVSVLCNLITFFPMGVFYVFCPMSIIVWMFPAGNEEMHVAIKTWLLWCPFMISPILISSALEKFVICQHKPIFATRSATVTVISIVTTLYFAATSVIESEHSNKETLNPTEALASEVFKFVMAIGTAKWCGTTFLILQIVILGKLESNKEKRRRFEVYDRYKQVVENGPDDDCNFSDLCNDDRHPIETEPIGIALIRAHFLTAIGVYRSYHGPEQSEVRDSDSSYDGTVNKKKPKTKRRTLFRSLKRFLKLASTYWLMAAPSLVAFSLDLWTLEVITILAARCGPVEVATWNLTMHSTNPMFSLAIATSVTAAVFVGNEEGKRFHIFDVDDEDGDEKGNKSGGNSNLKFPSTFPRVYSNPEISPNENTSLISLESGSIYTGDDDDATDSGSTYSALNPTTGAFTSHEFHHRSLHQQAKIHQINAKKYARTVVFVSSIIGVCVAIAIYFIWGKLNLFRHISSGLLREKMPSHNSNTSATDKVSMTPKEVNPVADLGEELMPYFAIFMLFDMPFYSMQGIFRGYTRLKSMMMVVFVALWLVTVPTAITLSTMVVDVFCLRSFTGALVIGCVAGISGFLIVLKYHNQI